MREIIALSVSETWEDAKREWALSDVSFAEEPETCLCGHYPIKEICTIENQKNGNATDVGNCCVKKFLGLPSESIFRGLRRIAADPSSSAGEAVVNHAKNMGILTPWEVSFYANTLRKRNLSFKQTVVRERVNLKILRACRSRQ